MKNLLNLIGAWTIKHHWIFLLVIFGLQWWTGENMQLGWTRQIHQLNGKLVFASLVYMAGNKLWLYLKRKGKI